MLQNILCQLIQLPSAQIIFNDHVFTVQQLGSRAQKLLPLLKKRQARYKGPIAFCMPNSPELICWHLACFHLGITIVPIIYEQTPEFIQQAVQLTNASYLFTTTEKLQLLNFAELSLQCMVETNDNECSLMVEDASSLNYLRDNPSTVDPNNLAMIIFSSGTSGTLKGIEHSYQSTDGFMQTLIEILEINHHLVYLIAQPMGHIGGITTTLITLLYQGTAILLKGFEVNEYIKAMSRYQPTHINLHTPLYYELINHPGINKKAFERAITCFAGGDTIPTDLPTQFSAVTGARMQIGYGMTETGIIIINRNPYGPSAGSCGNIISTAKVILKNPVNQKMANGSIGEMWIKSPGCCLGYWQMPDLNSQTFSDGWFRTHDLARIDDQGYWYLGRDSQIIKRGKRVVYPYTIENKLFDCPLVKTAAVIAVKDIKEGEVPVAFVELKSKGPNSNIEKDVMAYLKNYLEVWEMPIKIIVLDKLPLNETGKIDRGQLKKWL